MAASLRSSSAAISLVCHHFQPLMLFRHPFLQQRAAWSHRLCGLRSNWRSGQSASSRGSFWSVPCGAVGAGRVRTGAVGAKVHTSFPWSSSCPTFVGRGGALGHPDRLNL